MDFEESWRNAFGASPPLGHALRRDYSNNWTRFHALPRSKRYAEVNKERSEILQRANTLTTDCFGTLQKVWIVVAQYLDTSESPSRLYDHVCLKPSMTWHDVTEEPEEQKIITFYTAKIEWKNGNLDRFFYEIAENRKRGILFSEINDTVIAPYDGGFDIISLRLEKLAELETRYRTWMSDRSDKL